MGQFESAIQYFNHLLSGGKPSKNGPKRSLSHLQSKESEAKCFEQFLSVVKVRPVSSIYRNSFSNWLIWDDLKSWRDSQFQGVAPNSPLSVAHLRLPVFDNQSVRVILTSQEDLTEPVSEPFKTRNHKWKLRKLGVARTVPTVFTKSVWSNGELSCVIEWQSLES